MMGEGEADGVDGGGVERGLAGDGSDAVGAEELLHVVLFSIFIIRVLGVGVVWFVVRERATAITGLNFVVPTRRPIRWDQDGAPSGYGWLGTDNSKSNCKNNRRSFDRGSRDEAARTFAQDDNF